MQTFLKKLNAKVEEVIVKNHITIAFKNSYCCLKIQKYSKHCFKFYFTEIIITKLQHNFQWQQSKLYKELLQVLIFREFFRCRNSNIEDKKLCDLLLQLLNILLVLLLVKKIFGLFKYKGIFGKILTRDSSNRQNLYIIFQGHITKVLPYMSHS